MDKKLLRNAVFSCKGLGDGLISLILSHNLSLNGSSVETFHPFLYGMQNWFPCLPLLPLPDESKLEKVLGSFDRIFIFYEKTPLMQQVLKISQKKFPEKATILNPIATPNKDYPYWEQGRFDGRKTFCENLHCFSSKVLNLSLTTRSNGIVIPQPYRHKRSPNRVVLHATSSRPGKNWTMEKYLKLSDWLSQLGYDPVFVMSKEEIIEYPIVENVFVFDTLDALAGYIVESGWMIGNDSGLGHLASCLGLPTVTICRSNMSAAFWRPGWSPGKVVTPPNWIPNIKMLRLRDELWQNWISVKKVLEKFVELNRSLG